MKGSPREVRVIPLTGIPEVPPGDSLARLVVSAAGAGNLAFEPGDIVVLKHKIVSKSEGRIVRLDSVKPSRQALASARRNKNDARVIELALREAKRVLRDKHVLISETA